MPCKNLRCTVHNIAFCNTIQGNSHAWFFEPDAAPFQFDHIRTNQVECLSQFDPIRWPAVSLGKIFPEKINNRLNRYIKGLVGKSVIIHCPGNYFENFGRCVFQKTIAVQSGYCSCLIKTAHGPRKSFYLLKGLAHRLFCFIPGRMDKGHGHKGPHGQPGLRNLIRLAVELYGLG